MRCKLCNGGKKIIGMGCMEQSCYLCDGTGIEKEQKVETIDIDRIPEAEIFKTPYKRPSRAKQATSNNVAVGYDAKILTTGMDQTAIGSQPLQTKIKNAEPLQVVVQNAKLTSCK